MSNINFALFYANESRAIFRREEYGFAKHAHFQDKQDRCGMLIGS